MSQDRPDRLLAELDAWIPSAVSLLQQRVVRRWSAPLVLGELGRKV